MATSEARIKAAQLNGARSKGPVTEAGKMRSRAGALKHGLTGEGVVVTNEDAVEIERLSGKLEVELGPTTVMSLALIRRIATNIVRMDRCVSQETATLADRVRQAEDDFLAPEGLDEATIAELRAEAGCRAMFDPSKEAILARKYEAASERAMYRALKEFRQIEKEAKATNVAIEAQPLGSFFPVKKEAKVASVAVQAPAPAASLGSFFSAKEDALSLERSLAELGRKIPPAPAQPVARPVSTPSKPPIGGSSYVPFAIGKPR